MSVPRFARGWPIRTDPTRLRQILINLIGNALKFTEVGGVRLVTRFVPDDRGSVMQFDAVDTGIGMSDEQVSRLFQPFTRADASTTRKFGGTGLGLTISKRLAQILGGDVTVIETGEGIGTRFRVTVATGSVDGVRLIDEHEAAAGTPAVPAGGSVKPSLAGHRILLAEDSPDNQRLIGHVLNRAGAEAVVVDNGKQGVNTVLGAQDAGRPFCVVLMDMQMPVMDGYEATRMLRDKGYRGLIIALTAHAMQGDREKCIRAGCDEYTTKPIDRHGLLHLIETLLAERGEGSLVNSQAADRVAAF
ncbi:MAG: response regulator [Phycisphaerales bacterium]|nr:MAG: response regulator [Phycisphaerales bacterium]